MKLTGTVLTVAVAVFLLFPASLEASSYAKVGTAGAQFLKLGMGTRGAGMAGAFTEGPTRVPSLLWQV